MDIIKKPYIYSLLLIIFFAFAFRFNTFFYLHLDDDEGIYILMGHFINKGFLPYVHYWDHQPPLIYYLAALVQKLNIDSLIGVRILATIFVILTSYVLFFLSEIIFNKTAVSLSVSLLYVLLTGISNLGGCAFNNEIIFNLFSIFSLFILIKTIQDKNKITNYLLSGLIIGLGLITKQHVVFDLISFSFMIIILNKQYSVYAILKKLFIYLLASAIPTLLFVIYYYLKGHLSVYLDANLFSNFQYIKNEENTYANFITFLQNTFFFVYIIIFPIIPFFIRYYGIEKSNSIYFQLRFKLFLFFWLVLLLWSTTLSGTFYLHYYIQVLPVFVILNGYVIYRLLFIRGKIKIFGIILFVLLYFVFFIKSGMNYQIFDYKDRYDYIRLTSDYINKNKSKSDTLYVVNSDVILYQQTNIDIPTKYAFPSHLTDTKYERIFNIDQLKELKKVLDSKPTWIILDSGRASSYRDFKNGGTTIYLNTFLEDYYYLAKEFYSDGNDKYVENLNESLRKNNIKIYHCK